jgi:hypothetical protein
MATPVETEAVETETVGESKEVTEAEEAMAGLVVEEEPVVELEELEVALVAEVVKEAMVAVTRSRLTYAHSLRDRR